MQHNISNLKFGGNKPLFYNFSENNKNFCFIFLFFSLATLILNFNIFYDFFSNPIVGGWDGTSHVAIGKIYSETIFPWAWGWIPQWFGGMPFPQFYPPLFYWCLALAHHIFTFLSYSLLTKIIVSILIVITPSLISLMSYQFTKNYYSMILAGFISICFMGSDAQLSEFGIAINATLGNGLFTQLLSFIVFALWLMFVLKSNESRINRNLASLFLWLTLISNAHVIIVAICFCIPIVFIDVFKHKLNSFKKLGFKYFFLFVLPIVGSLFWYIPMLVNYNYFVTKNLGIRDLESIIGYLPIIIIMIIGVLFIAIRINNYPIIVICSSFVMIILLIILSQNDFVSELPFQPFRWLGVIYQLSPIIISFIVGFLITELNQRKYQYFISLSFIIPFMIFLITNQVGNIVTYNDYHKDNVPEIINYLKNKQEKPGRVLVEYYRPNKQPKSQALNALLGENGIDTNYIVFRESSIGSIFMTPLRNSLSDKTEVWGINSLLADNLSYLNQNIENHLQKARFMGIKYLLITSNEMVEALDGVADVKLEKVFGTWKLYHLTNNINYATILQYKPNLYIGDATFKRRQLNNPNLTTLQEYLFLRNKSDTIIAHGNDSNLDNYSIDKLNYFSTIILDKYSYSNLDNTINKLLEFSRKRWIIFVKDPLDPLQEKILSIDDELAKKNIYFIPNLKDIPLPSGKITQQDIFEFFDQVSRYNNLILNFLDQHKIQIDNQELKKSSIQLINQDNSRFIKLSLKTDSQENLPILIKYNYFPAWKLQNQNAEVFLASPTFMLVFAKDNLSLYFSTPWYVTVSLIASLIALITMIYLGIVDFLVVHQ